MKYKLGDEVYLKGVITSINSCAEINYPYEVKAAGEFVTAAEEHLEPINKSELGHAEEAPRYLRNILARLRELPEHDREVWLKGIMDEFELDFSHAKWREGYEQGKFDGAVEAGKSNKVVIPQFVAEWIEVCKEHLTHSLYTAMNPNFMKENGQSFDLILWIKKASNQETFARAWLDGYEVEQERRYKAVLPNLYEEENVLHFSQEDEVWYFNNDFNDNVSVDKDSRYHTRKELEDAGFGWVFDCEGVEVQEVE